MAISLPIVSKFDDKGIKQAELSIGSFQGIALGVFAKIGAVAVDAFAQASRAAFDFGVESVKAASSFNETTSAISQVFGEGSKQLEDFAATAASSFGQSRTQALAAAKTFGIFGNAAGLAGSENVEFSKTLTTLASDLASFNDTSVDEAITALGAALRGESEPIRRFGVLLDDATLKARAMQMGIYDGTGSLSQQQRVLAAYQEILAQTTTQQGDFARTADGVANSSRTLQATWENLQITVGNALLPAVQAIIPQLTAFIDEMVAKPEFNQFIADMGINFQNLLAYLPTVLTNLGSFGKDILPVISSFFPLINESLAWLGQIFFGIANTDPASTTSSFAESMKSLATSINAVTGALNGLRNAYNNLPDWVRWFISPLASGVSVKNLKMPSGATVGESWNYFFGGGFTSGKPYPGQAEGGTTIRPGLSWVGENGPELMSMPRGASVIPLDRINSISNGNGNSITVNVTAGMGTDGAALGEQIVTAIRKYERTSGQVFARA